MTKTLTVVYLLMAITCADEYRVGLVARVNHESPFCQNYLDAPIRKLIFRVLKAFSQGCEPQAQNPSSGESSLEECTVKIDDYNMAMVNALASFKKYTVKLKDDKVEKPREECRPNLYKSITLFPLAFDYLIRKGKAHKARNDSRAHAKLVIAALRTNGFSNEKIAEREREEAKAWNEYMVNFRKKAFTKVIELRDSIFISTAELTSFRILIDQQITDSRGNKYDKTLHTNSIRWENTCNVLHTELKQMKHLDEPNINATLDGNYAVATLWHSAPYYTKHPNEYDTVEFLGDYEPRSEMHDKFWDLAWKSGIDHCTMYCTDKQNCVLTIVLVRDAAENPVQALNMKRVLV